jgi:hypothetical protein
MYEGTQEGRDGAIWAFSRPWYVSLSTVERPTFGKLGVLELSLVRVQPVLDVLDAAIGQWV